MKALVVRIIWFALATAGLIAAPLFAATYKWVDEKGAVHYSQTPPSAHKFETLRDPQSTKRPWSEDSPPEDNKVAERRAEDRETTATMCREAKERLATLEANPGKLVIKQSDGNMHKLSEEERLNHIKLTKDRIKEVCSLPH